MDPLTRPVDFGDASEAENTRRPHAVSCASHFVATRAAAQHERDPVFKLEVPTSCPDVPQEVLMPRNTWSDKAAYDTQAKKLAGMFIENFKRFEKTAKPEVKAAGPKG